MSKKTWLLALLAIQPAFAADWAPLPDAGTGDQYFYDKSKLVIKEEQITYWKKVLFKAPQPVKGQEAVSGLLRERIHCGEHTAQLLSYLYYSATGETLEYVSQEEAAPLPIIPDTVGDAFDRVLCPKVWRKQEEQRIKTEQAVAEAELRQAARKPVEAGAAAPTAPRVQPPQLQTPTIQTPTVPEPAKPATPLPPNVHLPDQQQTLPPLPMPQIMEQLY